MLYDSLFGHRADIAGLIYWTNRLNAGTFTIAQAAATIAVGALGSDLRAFQAKTAAAIYFTNALDTPTKVLYYQGDRAIVWGKGYLAFGDRR